MALNPTGNDSFNWNYSRPTDPGYSTELTGTILALQETQAMNFGSGGKPTSPKFWDSGQPMMMIRVLLCGPSGGFRSLTFQPASKAAKEGTKKSIHLDLFALTGNTDMNNLIGKTVKISTVEGHYGLGNPRPWTVVEVKDQGPFEPTSPIPPMFLVPQLLADGAVSGGQVVAPQTAAGTADDIPF